MAISPFVALVDDDSDQRRVVRNGLVARVDERQLIVVTGVNGLPCLQGLREHANAVFVNRLFTGDHKNQVFETVRALQCVRYSPVVVLAPRDNRHWSQARSINSVVNLPTTHDELNLAMDTMVSYWMQVNRIPPKTA